MTSHRPKPSSETLARWLAHFSFWFGLLLATPAFIVLNNPQDAPFAIYGFIAQASLAVLLTSTISWWLSQAAGERFAWWCARLLLALALLMAIQGNVVHDLFDYGAFNGERVDFRAHGGWFWLEWLGWLAAIPLLTFSFGRLRPLPAWLPALPVFSFLGLLLPALLAPPRALENPADSSGLDPAVFSFSRQSNLVHLLPDGFQADTVEQVLREHPQLAARFRGFTLFTQHAGRYPGTAPSLYAMLTGKPYDFQAGWDHRRISEDIQQNSYANELARQGYRLDLVPISRMACPGGADSCIPRPFNDMKARGYFPHEGEGTAYSLRLVADLTLFRLTPMFLKERIYNDGHWLMADTTLDGSSPWPDPVLQEWTARMTTDSERPVYKWYHYIGTHVPPRWNANCVAERGLPVEASSYAGQAYCVLSHIANFLDALEAHGIYDQTAILISGDHGHNTVPLDQQNPLLNYGSYKPLLGTGRPALLVKQKNQRQALAFSEAPSQLLQVRDTALALAGLETEGVPAWEASDEERRFRMYPIGQFWSGQAVPFTEYEIGHPVNDASQWAVSDLSRGGTAPASYDPVNKETARGWMMGARLRSTIGMRDGAWIRGRQLAFLINLPGTARPRELLLDLEFRDWMAPQGLELRLNSGQAVRVEAVGFEPSRPDGRVFRIPLPVADQRSGNNFISLVFDQAPSEPGDEEWNAVGFVRSIYVEDVQ